MKRKCYLLSMTALLLLAALACGLISKTDPAPDGILFQDDFSDTSTGWDRVDVEEGVTDYADGVYRIFVNTGSTDVWANPGLEFTDAVIEVEATKVDGPDDNDFGVVCRYNDSENFYFFIISSDGFYALGKVVDGVQELIGESEMIPADAIITGNATNVIEVGCVGSLLSFSVNGTQLNSIEDTTFSSGDVGLIAGTFDTPGTEIHFDNFIVRQP